MCLKRIKLTVAALALSACGASAAGEARFVPLDTLFDTGIRHSLLLEADRIGQQMAAARRESAQSQLAILTDLLDADNLRLNAELQLATARAEAVYHYYELLNATGQL